MRSIHSFRCRLTCSLSRAYKTVHAKNLYARLHTYLSVQRHEEVWILLSPQRQSNIMNLLVGALLSPKVEVSKVLKESKIM